jgi:hypothetical protein
VKQSVATRDIRLQVLMAFQAMGVAVYFIALLPVFGNS